MKLIVYIIVDKNSQNQQLIVTQIQIHLHKAFLPCLAGNPFRCDCELLPFLLHLNSTSGPGTDVPLCLPPEIPQGIECPYPCTCACSESDSGDHYIEVDCRQRNISEIPVLFSNVTDEVRFASIHNTTQICNVRPCSHQTLNGYI